MWDSQTRRLGGSEASVVSAAQRRQRLAVGANPRWMIDGSNQPRSGDIGLAPYSAHANNSKPMSPLSRLWDFSSDVFRVPGFRGLAHAG